MLMYIFRKPRQENLRFEDRLDCRMSSRPVWVLERCCLKIKSKTFIEHLSNMSGPEFNHWYLKTVKREKWIIKYKVKMLFWIVVRNFLLPNYWTFRRGHLFCGQAEGKEAGKSLSLLKGDWTLCKILGSYINNIFFVNSTPNKNMNMKKEISLYFEI